MRIKSFYLILFVLVALFSCENKNEVKSYNEGLHIVPEPKMIEQQTGEFTLTSQTAFVTDNDSLKTVAGYFAEKIQHSTGHRPDIVKEAKDNCIRLTLNPALSMKDEGYKLIVTSREISVQAKSAHGIFYAMQTVMQLLPAEIESEEPVKDVAWTLPCVVIEDEPAYPYRGMMLDVSRHFHDVDFVKKQLDVMAMFKINRFHWHLTNDHLWTIEIKKYPKLTEIGAFRDSTQIGGFNSTKYDPNPHGGFYTQDDIREIVAYATARHINIIPEIEIPGHASASIAAYPWLGTTGKQIKVSCRFGVHHEVYNVANPKVFDFLDDVIDEMIQLFPGEIFHIGGDEVRYNHWKESEETRKFMEEKGIQTYPELQVWITNLMSEKLKAKGRRMMGWNEITGVQLHDYQQEKVQKQEQKLSEGTIVQIWKGSPELIKATAEQGYDILNSYNRYTYLDYDYNTIPLEKAYTFNPIPTDLPKSLESKILGVGCQMWGEFIPTVKEMNLKVYPRIAAYAEVGWTRPDQKDFKRFTQSLQKLKAIWKKEGIEYYETPQPKK